MMKMEIWSIQTMKPNKIIPKLRNRLRLDSTATAYIWWRINRQLLVRPVI